MNLTQIQSECGKLLGDPTNDRWPLADLTTRINQAQIEIQGATDAVKTLENLTPTVNISAVTLNASTMDIVRATKTLTDGSIRPLPLIGREELEYLYPNWQQWTAGEPLYAWYDGTNQQINLIPKPDSNFVSISNSIQVWESRKPADLANAMDIPFDSNNQMLPFHYAIIHWVVSTCFQTDGTPESLAKSKFHKSGSMLGPGEYEKEVGRIMAEFDAPTAVPSRILFKPQGGRTGLWYLPSKGYPLSWPW